MRTQWCHREDEDLYSAMKEIVVISGKGGTGKTSMVALFTTLAGDGTRATWEKICG